MISDAHKVFMNSVLDTITNSDRLTVEERETVLQACYVPEGDLRVDLEAHVAALLAAKEDLESEQKQ